MMPPAIAGTPAVADTRATARKLCTGMKGPQGFGGMCPQFNLAFSLEEAPTFGWGSSLKPCPYFQPVERWRGKDLATFAAHTFL
jgi:hypothetical protein